MRSDHAEIFRLTSNLACTLFSNYLHCVKPGYFMPIPPLLRREREWIQGARSFGDEGISANMSRRQNTRNV